MSTQSVIDRCFKLNAGNNAANIAVCFYFHNLWKTIGTSEKIAELYNKGIERNGQILKSKIVKVSSTRFETKEEIITYSNRKAEHAKEIKSVKSYVGVVLGRESTALTAVGFGIAIPHGESDAVTETSVACLHLLHPAQQDHDEVDPVFIVGIPFPSRNREHLYILAMLGRHLMKETFHKELRKIRTDQELCECTKFPGHRN